MPSFLLLCSFAGGLLGPELVGSASASGDDEIKSGLKAFTQIYSVVEQHAATPVDPDKAVYAGAIAGALRTLDPHSNFYEPRLYKVLQEEQRGHYYGVGMLVGARGGKVIVLYPFPGAPAHRAGVHPYDVISSIDGRSAAGLNTGEVADRLKGPRGSQVQVRVARDGVAEPVEFSITREDIPRSSVQKAFRIRPNVAFVRVESFNENTGRDLDVNLKRVGEEHLEGLILDLRGNPGGILNEGVAVADRFLRKGQLVVSHRGRSSAERPYVARRGNTGRLYPVVVLVDRASASAAEIVAGALQDHDRAWIVGENTFGKGLVQSQFPLSASAGLLLTTAKYYTPSGRLIQRDYAHTSFLDYYNRKDVSQKDPLDAKTTDSGRTVFGGGGIEPDEKLAPAARTAFQTRLERREMFMLFAARYFALNGTKLPRNWEPDLALETAFHDFLLEKDVPFTEAEFAEVHDWIRAQLKQAGWLFAFGREEADRLAAQTDPQVERAIDSLPKAKALLENAATVVARRAAR